MKFSLTATVQLDNITVGLSTTIWILGVWDDTKLRWGPYIKEALIWSQAQAGALDKLLKSTWGPFFTSARRLYTVIIWLLMIYYVSA